MDKDDIANLVVKIVMERDGLTSVPAPESLHNSDLHEEIVVAVGNYLESGLPVTNYLLRHMVYDQALSFYGNPKRLDAFIELWKSISNFRDNYKKE